MDKKVSALIQRSYQRLFSVIKKNKKNKSVIRLISFSFVLVVFVAGVLTANEARAQEVSGASQIFISHKDLITISGSGFGIKSPAAPLVWENFEWGSDGDAIEPNDPNSRWTQWQPADTQGQIDTGYKYGQGTRSAHGNPGDQSSCNFGMGGWGSNWIWTEFSASPGEETVYVSYMYRWHTDKESPSPDGMRKHGRLSAYTGSNPYSDTPAYTATFWHGVQSFVLVNDGDSSVEDWAGPNDIFTEDAWHRSEMYWLGSTGGSSDGAYDWWVNLAELGGLAANHLAYMTRDSGYGSYGMRTFMAPLNWVDGDSSVCGEQWLDNIYIDNTRARVEIGDHATWANCTHREIQIPTAWSDSSIAITANQGSFSDGETAYLFVVGENGNTSNGYPITFGSGEDTTPPTRSNPQPTGTLSSGTTSTTISLTTNETATCKYSETAGTDYDSMTLQLSSGQTNTHTATVSDLSDGETKTYYIRCQDESGNANTDDNFTISFNITSSKTYSISNFINLVSDWLKSESGLVSDVNNDGVVNTRDLGIMMSNWSE